MAGNVTEYGDNYYRLRYKDKSKYIHAKSLSAAQKELAAFVTQIDRGEYNKEVKITFTEFVKRWDEGYAKTELAPKTRFRYMQMLEARVIPVFGKAYMNAIKPLDIINFYAKIRGKHKYMTKDKDGKTLSCESPGLSEMTIKHHHRLLHSIFEKAIRWGVLNGKNIISCVDTPKVRKTKMRFFQQEELHEMLDALEKEDIKYKTGVYLALLTGARLGEIMGLEWGDIDFESMTIHISRSSQCLPRIGTFTKQPKNESSIRTISISSELAKVLQEYKEAQESKDFDCSDDKRLFVQANGEPMHPFTLTHWFPKFLKKNNVNHVNFHGLRHTNATLLLSNGTDTRTVAGRLGHSSSVTTQTVYSHFVMKRDQQAAALLEKVIKPKFD